MLSVHKYNVALCCYPNGWKSVVVFISAAVCADCIITFTAILEKKMKMGQFSTVNTQTREAREVWTHTASQHERLI